MKKRNWSKYNKALIERGNITFYIDEKSLMKRLLKGLDYLAIGKAQ